jgi:hypothetical protein
MVEALEEQATTDGLTGLVNHRTFQERFSAMLGRAERHPMRVSFLLTDIERSNNRPSLADNPPSWRQPQHPQRRDRCMRAGSPKRLPAHPPPAPRGFAAPVAKLHPARPPVASRR